MKFFIIAFLFTGCIARTGPMGPPGPQGLPGRDGRDGKDGKDGKNAVGVESKSPASALPVNDMCTKRYNTLDLI